MRNINSISMDLFNTVNDSERLYYLACNLGGLLPDGIFERVDDFFKEICDEKEDMADAGNNSYIEEKYRNETLSFVRELEARVKDYNTTIVLESEEGYLQVEDQGNGEYFTYTLYTPEMTMVSREEYMAAIPDGLSGIVSLGNEPLCYDVAKNLSKQLNLTNARLVTNPADFIEQAYVLGQNSKTFANLPKTEDLLKTLSSDFSKIAFKYNIIDCDRAKVFSAFADACVDRICRGCDIAAVVNILYDGGYVSTKRDSDLFYKDLVNKIIYSGSKLSKTALYQNLDTLQKINGLNAIILRAQKAIEENIDDSLKVRVVPVHDYEQIMVRFCDGKDNPGRLIYIEGNESSLELLKKIYDCAATFHKEYGYEDRHNVKLNLALNAEFVHSVFIEAERMSSSEKLNTIKSIFKDATPDLKERLCNLYLGDYSRELRQFLQNESLKMAEEREEGVIRTGITPKKSQNIEK